MSKKDDFEHDKAEKEYLFYQTQIEDHEAHPPEEKVSEKRFALDTLERYSGCSHKDFCSNLLLTNFPHYVEQFSKDKKAKIFEGSMFKVAHAPADDVSIIDFKIGSPAAALVMDLVSFLPIKANLVLGMCGGLRRRYKIGEYILPVASIRDEGTSNHYFPAEVPALSNFLITRAATETLEKEKILYHIGTTYTTNKRFWEFNEDFKTKLKGSRAQAIEMECATLFTASYSRNISLGALLLISDLPLDPRGVKTKKSAGFVFQKYMKDHISLGVKILHKSVDMLKKKVKGIYDRSLYKK